MDKALQIFKKHGAHYYEGDEQAIIDAMNEFADEWISVGDDTPKNGQEIMFFSQVVYFGKWYEWSISVNANSVGCQYEEILKTEITHWKPIPKGPKSK